MFDNYKEVAGKCSQPGQLALPHKKWVRPSSFNTAPSKNMGKQPNFEK